MSYKSEVAALNYLVKKKPKLFRLRKENGSVRKYLYLAWQWSPGGGFKTWEYMADVHMESSSIKYHDNWGRRNI